MPDIESRIPEVLCLIANISAIRAVPTWRRHHRWDRHIDGTVTETEEHQIEIDPMKTAETVCVGRCAASGPLSTSSAIASR